jgi:hypothetical protein
MCAAVMPVRLIICGMVTVGMLNIKNQNAKSKIMEAASPRLNQQVPPLRAVPLRFTALRSE